MKGIVILIILVFSVLIIQGCNVIGYDKADYGFYD